ncbi:hypothetical protein D3C84_1212740 [compost metagenome]
MALHCHTVLVHPLARDAHVSRFSRIDVDSVDVLARRQVARHVDFLAGFVGVVGEDGMHLLADVRLDLPVRLLDGEWCEFFDEQT